MLEMVDSTVEVMEVGNLDGEMEISMHALSGSFNPKTIRLLDQSRGSS